VPERPQVAQQQDPPPVVRTETPAPPPATTPAETRPDPEPEKPVQVAAATPPPVVQTPAPRPQPQVQYGDLVQMGAGVVPPKVTQKAEPRYPPSAIRLKRAANVDVKVLVDERGKVMDAERIGVKAGFGFDEAAVEAARRSVFQPATKDGVRVKMWFTLRFNFKPRE
jgi:protein TonB